MALAGILRQLGLTLGQVGAQGLGAMGNAMQQQANPQAFQQQQENQRLQAEIAQQLNLYNSLSASESAQLDLQRHAQQEQAGRDVWAALAGGATLTPSGSTPDFMLGGRGFNHPTADSGYTIDPDSELGKHLGISTPIANLPAAQYLKAYQDFAGEQQAHKDAVASKALLDTQKQNARLWLTHRFSPEFSQTIYGASDPTAQLESQNLANELEATPDLKSMAAWQDKARGYQTQWEKMQTKKLELKNQLALKAAEASSKGDPHLTSTILSQSRSLDDLEKPIQSEWDTGNNILALANQRTPAADAQLITAMMPYVTGVKRFNQAEIKNAAGGATAWTDIQRTLNKFASNPNAAQIPDVQRQQLISILQQKQANLKNQLDKINDTRDDIAGMEQSADVLKRSSRLHRELSIPDDSAQGVPQVGSTFNGGRVLSVKRIN